MLLKADDTTAPLQHLAVAGADTAEALHASVALHLDYGLLCIENVS